MGGRRPNAAREDDGLALALIGTPELVRWRTRRSEVDSLLLTALEQAFATIDALKLDGETLMDAFARLAAAYAVALEPMQTKAADRLGVTERVFNYELQRLGLRPVDRRRAAEEEETP